MDLEQQILEKATQDKEAAQKIINDQAIADAIKNGAKAGDEITVVNAELPVKPSDVVSLIVEAVKKEVQEDPEKRGYQGRTFAEIVDMLNNPYNVVVGQKTTWETDSAGVPVVEDGKLKMSTQDVVEQRPPRVGQIFIGIPYAPNAVDLDLLQKALS